MEALASDSPAAPAAPDGPKPGTYSPVTVHQEDTVGAIFLGIIAITLLVAFVRAEARNRALVTLLAAARAAAQ